MPEYPDVNVDLVGEDGNVFAIIGRVSNALKRAGYREAADKFRQDAVRCRSYDEVLQMVVGLVNVS